jgi:hypothetical protein
VKRFTVKRDIGQEGDQLVGFVLFDVILSHPSLFSLLASSIQSFVVSSRSFVHRPSLPLATVDAFPKI